jgi:hypothetical protein
VRPARELFAQADHVLIPKFSTYSAWTDRARLEYGGYLSQNFPAHEETQSWIVLSREGAVARPSSANGCAPHESSLLPRPVTVDEPAPL